MKFKIGYRVTRPVYMDDGTWTARGDSCLPESPLRHGAVINVSKEAGRIPITKVRWDEDGKELWYYEHGLDLEEEP